MGRVFWSLTVYSENTRSFGIPGELVTLEHLARGPGLESNAAFSTAQLNRWANKKERVLPGGLTNSAYHSTVKARGTFHTTLMGVFKLQFGSHLLLD